MASTREEASRPKPRPPDNSKSDLDYLWNILEDAEELGIKLAVAGELPIWEAHAVSRHQLEVKRIDRSVEPISSDAGGCTCISIPDVYIHFPDGSLMRP